jgi:hypothetical protein
MVHLHHFSKIKSQKESQNSRNPGFSYYFCMMIEGSGSGSIPLNNAPGSGRPKAGGFGGSGSGFRIHTSDYWIRIREAQKHVDPVDPDPDPQHWKAELCRSGNQGGKGNIRRRGGMGLGERSAQLSFPMVRYFFNIKNCNCLFPGPP